MRKSLWLAVLAAILGIIVLGLLYVFLGAETDLHRKYKSIQIGMSVDEVQAILGAGTPLKMTEVPQIVVPVNPADAVAAREREKRRGTPSTAREYPVRHQPVVEGDHVLKWESPTTGEYILVAFKEGRACGKYYWIPSL